MDSQEHHCWLLPHLHWPRNWDITYHSGKYKWKKIHYDNQSCLIEEIAKFSSSLFLVLLWPNSDAPAHSLAWEPQAHSTSSEHCKGQSHRQKALTVPCANSLMSEGLRPTQAEKCQLTIAGRQNTQTHLLENKQGFFTLISDCVWSSPWEQCSFWIKLIFFPEYCYSDSTDSSPAKILLCSATITLIFHFCPQKRGAQPACALRIAIKPGKYLEALQLRSIFLKTSVYKDWSIVKFNSSH